MGLIKNRLAPTVTVALLAALLLNPVFINAQNNDSAKTKKGFFKQWWLAGINVYVGAAYGDYKIDYSELFSHLPSSPQALSKYANDIAETSKFENGQSRTKYNFNQAWGLRFTFKPRNYEDKRFISYTELNVGLRFNEFGINTELTGNKVESDSLYSAFYTYYRYRTNAVGLEISGTLQTPGIFGVVAFYTGPGVYIEKTVKPKVYSGHSVAISANLRQFSATYNEVVLNTAHTDLYAPDYNFSFYLPVGGKLNISPRINFFLEYAFEYRLNRFSNNYTQGYWFKGVYAGLRYKLNPKRDIIPQKKSGDAPIQRPEPFY